MHVFILIRRQYRVFESFSLHIRNIFPFSLLSIQFNVHFRNTKLACNNLKLLVRVRRWYGFFCLVDSISSNFIGTATLVTKFHDLYCGICKYSGTYIRTYVYKSVKAPPFSHFLPNTSRLKGFQAL